MKFINYLQGISGVGIFPLVSLITFVVFFSAVVVFALNRSKGYINHMKNIPFNKED